MNPSQDIKFDEDWEEWNPASGTSFRVHMLAGSLAGAAEHLVVFPIDTFKTFLQTEGSGGTKELSELIRTQGQARLWRGVSTTLLGCIPAHAGYFSIYEFGKEQFGVSSTDDHTPIAAAFTGALATVAHDLIMSPMDVLKQRMQLGFHANLQDCLKQTIKSEGLIALFRSYPTTLAMNIPFQSLSVSMNESLKKLQIFPEDTLLSFFGSGFLSGGFAGLCTTPLDVIRTRLNTQHLKFSKLHPSHRMEQQRMFPRTTNLFFSSRPPPAILGYQQARAKYTSPLRCPFLGWTSTGSSTYCPSSPTKSGLAKPKLLPPTNFYKGPWQASKHIFETDGYAGFFKGARQRVMVQAPGFAISWTAYETFKSLLTA